VDEKWYLDIQDMEIFMDAENTQDAWVL